MPTAVQLSVFPQPSPRIGVRTVIKRRLRRYPLEATPGRAQDPPGRLPEARFARTIVNSMTLYAMLPHTSLRATRCDCKPPLLAL
jgi:hypothetical protein